jgi:hypothetical protein
MVCSKLAIEKCGFVWWTTRKDSFEFTPDAERIPHQCIRRKDHNPPCISYPDGEEYDKDQYIQPLD